MTLAYLISGHTHENIDGTFGQITVRLAASEFASATAVVRLLGDLLKGLGIDPGARGGTLAYKLDQVADWHDWWGELDLSLSRLTGPLAPHFFRLCRRRDLGAAPGGGSETALPAQPLPGAPPPALDDVMLVVKDRMADQQVLQVATLLPAATADALRRRQPIGTRDRKAVEAKAVIARTAHDLHAKGHLALEATEYLAGWALGTLPREPRPAAYSCLMAAAQGPPLPAPPVPGGPRRPPRLVVIRARHGRLLRGRRDGDSADDDAAPGPLVEESDWV